MHSTGQASWQAIEAAFGRASIATRGPEGRYGAILFIEKEGFAPLLEHAQIAERFDIAIMSTKGLSVTAARLLVDETCARYRIPLFVMHDFDPSGFSIFETLHTSSRRYAFKNQSGADFKVVDIGLRLEDVERLGLHSEPFAFGRKTEEALRNRLMINGATEAEADFLLTGNTRTQGKRVELNAMTSRQFLDLLESKLTEHGVGKVIPDADRLDDAYRLFARRERAKAIADAAIADAAAEPVETPTDLDEQVRAYLEDHPPASWDQAVAAICSKE